MPAPIIYQISDLDCPDCARSLEEAVGAMEGVQEAVTY